MGNVLRYCEPIHHQGLPRDPRKWSDKDITKAAHALFEAYDKDGSLSISVSELEEFFTDMNQSLSDFGMDSANVDVHEGTQELLAKYNVDEDGALDFDEFLPLFKAMLTNVIHSDTEEKLKLRGLENVIKRSFSASGGVVRLLMVGLNYEGSDHELTGISDCKNMLKIADRAGVEDITELYDDGSTELFPYNYNFIKAVKEIGRRCSKHDVLVIFYAGHGTNVPDADGDEEDGMDEAFCTIDVNGELTEDSVLIDDHFSRAISKFVPRKTRVLVITDCCHSASIVDIDSFQFDHEILALSAAGDDECAEEQEDTDGGKFTYALLKAVEELDEGDDNYEYTVQEVYNRMLHWMHDASQRIGIMNANIKPNEFPWPLPKAGATTGWHLHMDEQ